MSERGEASRKARQRLPLIVVGLLVLSLTMTVPTSRDAASASDGVIVHVVRQGETLWEISRAYGVDVDGLVRLNELSDPGRLSVGQKLVIREGEARLHIVQQGENLTRIARTYGVSVDDLMALNDLSDPNLLSVGQQLVVAPRIQRTHVIAPGDTLWDIAREYEVTIDAIVASNGLANPRLLSVGQQLVIPAIGGGDGAPVLPALARRSSQPVSFSWPVQGRITSSFGPRWGRMHNGLDIAAPTGTPVYAAAPGKVTYSDGAGTYGLLVMIDHGNGIETRYAHNSRLLVRVGEKVERGQRIALVGSTGNSTGPHLHFEVLVDGEALDPAGWLPPR